MDIEKIYMLYFKDVYKFIYNLSKNKSIAEDITQDTFLKAMKNIDKFDGRKDIKAWLFTIAKNTYYTYYNKEKKFTDYEMQDNISSCDNDILENFTLNDDYQSILKILHNMNEPYKEVFMLRFFGELSFDNISSLFSKSEGWARITYYRAKKQIQEKMEEKENG